MASGVSGGWFLAGVLRRGGGRAGYARPARRAGSCSRVKARGPAPQGPAAPQVGKNHPPRPRALSPVGQCPQDVQLAAEHGEVLPELLFPVGVHGRVPCRAVVALSRASSQRPR